MLLVRFFQKPQLLARGDLENADLLFAKVLGFKAHNAIDRCKERIVLADADVGAGMHVCAALTHEDVAREHELTVRTLRPETLGMAVAAVTGRTNAFFMRKQLQIHLEHIVTPPCVVF